MCIRSTGRDWKSYVLIIKWHWDQNENCGASQSAIRNPINLSCSTKSAKYRLESANLSDSRMSTCDSQSSARISQPPIFICTKHWLNKHEYEIRLIFLFLLLFFPFHHCFFLSFPFYVFFVSSLLVLFFAVYRFLPSIIFWVCFSVVLSSWLFSVCTCFVHLFSFVFLFAIFLWF